MELFDFTRLRSKFEEPNPKYKVRIFLFTVKKDDVTILSDSKDDRLTSFLTSQHPAGTVGEFFSLEKDLFVCIGKTDEKDKAVSRTNACKAMKSLYANLKRFNNCEVVFEDCEYTEDAIFGLIMAGYSYDFLKKSKDETSLRLSSEKYSRIIETAHAQNIARFLGDTPANLMTPALFVEYANRIFAGDNVEITAHPKSFIIEQQMNLVMSVAQGSVQEPKLLRIKYKGRAASGVDISLVGKGVTFDTGGISIKPAPEMYRMKHDMMGAGTLISSLKLAVVLGVKANITATFPLVENMPSGTATKPGDVFRSMSGKTVEVDNTDAEGRLILADALTLAQRDDSPKYLFDAATLTGAMSIALGKVYAGFFTEDDEVARAICSTGVECNDLFWRLPLSPFYREVLKSHVADIYNTGGLDAGSSKAAEFIREFVDTSKVKWVHFDIAGVEDRSHIPEIYGTETTGRPVRSFIRLFEKLVE